MGTKQKNRKKWIITGVCALVLIAAGVIGGIAVNSRMKQSSYSETIQTAEKYVSSGDYEQAIVAYQNAIETVPDKDEGYLGLAEVYLTQGETSAAKITLKKGYLRTESVKIRYMLDGIENGSGLVRTVDTKVESQTLELKGEFGWNTAFIQQIENFTYTDFQKEFGGSPEIVRTGKGEVEVVHPNLAATCYYSDTAQDQDIVDDNRNRPDDTAMPEQITLDSISLLFKNFTGTVTLEKLQRISSSVLKPVTTEERTYVEISTASIVARIETDGAGNIVSATAWNEIILTEANQNRDSKNVFSGVVMDAVTGDGVGGATVRFTWDKDRSVYTETVTGADGSFSVEIDPGEYTVTVSAEDYQTEEFKLEVEEDHNYSGEQFVISPELAAGTARIVLEWGAEPVDLDSYLRGETDDGEDVFVSYYRKQCSGRDGLLAELDVDDVNGYGPETVTLYDLNGVYSFEVVDFRATGTFQEHGATVKVYLPGKSQPEVITLDPGAGVNIVWEVFELDHGELKVLNRAPANENLGHDSK